MTEQIDYDPNTVLEALNNKADRDLNNVTDGTYQVLTTKNITNCITKIPQGIKLEISNETVTLKSGSVLRKADGTTVIVNEDKSISVAALTRKSLIGYSDNGLYVLTVENFFSRDTAPDNYNIMVWLDTATKTIKYTTNKGVNWTERGDTLPLGEISSKTSIDQVFNGFGYIGSTIFALPGVEGLIPKGRNADGSLNSTKFTTTTTSIKTFSGTADVIFTVYTPTGIPTATATKNYYYNEGENYNYFDGNKSSLHFVFANGSFENGRITSFNPKTTFQILDGNNKEEIISWGMPDYDAGIDITTYTSTSNQFAAPCVGFINVVYLAQASNSACPHIGNKTFGSYNEGAIADNVTLLISEGETFYCTGMYANKGNGSNMFYPMKGVV